jgi:hypothetical protein
VTKDTLTKVENNARKRRSRTVVNDSDNIVQESQNEKPPPVKHESKLFNETFYFSVCKHIYEFDLVLVADICDL